MNFHFVPDAASSLNFQNQRGIDIGYTGFCLLRGNNGFNLLLQPGPVLLGIALNNLGLVYSSLEEYDNAEAKFRQALTVYEAAGYRRDGSVRESDFRGVHQREPRLVKPL